MRKEILLILICVACVTFGGCFIEQAPLNDKELGVVAQYAADVLLKHNKNYSDFLLTEKQLTPTPTRQLPPEIITPTDTPEPTPSPTVKPGDPTGPANPADPSDTPIPTQTPVPTEVPDNTVETFRQVADLIGADGFVIKLGEYTNPVEEAKYSVGDGTINLPAREDGKHYLIIKFIITNNSDSSKYLNCFAQEPTGILNINAKTNLYPCDTLSLNDLRYVGVGEKPEVLEAGKSYEAVLIYAVDKDTEITRAALTLVNKDKESVVIKIK